jgi:hypothetical protein
MAALMRLPFVWRYQLNQVFEILGTSLRAQDALITQCELLQMQLDAANELATNSMRIARHMVRLIDEGLDEDNMILARDWARELSDVIAVREEHGL